MSSCVLRVVLLWTRTGSSVRQGVSACQQRRQRLCWATAGLGCWQEGEHDVPPCDSTIQTASPQWRLKCCPLEGDPPTPPLLGCDLSCPPAAFSQNRNSLAEVNKPSVAQRCKSSPWIMANICSLHQFWANLKYIFWGKYDPLMAFQPLQIPLRKIL